ncbi:hypothetical protein [Aquimarina agarivorans]|uniref:hypothetical protein n=1 Tax=Aquimarina agarivorans TaxID=980584 RepID=UPI00031964F5|nr:hypothetical protein [Aquimarina agarivorans]
MKVAWHVGGDSGGPLVVEADNDDSTFILVGTVSGGEGEPCSDFGFWGNVAKAASWITLETGIKPYQASNTSSIDDYLDASEKELDFIVWPNPAKEAIHIRSKKEINKAMIYTLSGQEILKVTDF